MSALLFLPTVPLLLGALVSCCGAAYLTSARGWLPGLLLTVALTSLAVLLVDWVGSLTGAFSWDSSRYDCFVCGTGVIALANLAVAAALLFTETWHWPPVLAWTVAVLGGAAPGLAVAVTDPARRRAARLIAAYTRF